MGIILGALAGAGGQLADFADKDIAQQQKLQALSTESDLAQNRAEALEQFKVSMADQQRQQMVGRVSTAAGNIADTQMAPIVAQEQAGIQDPSSWTPEQQAAVDQSNAITRQGIVSQAISDGSAGLATGDIPPEKAMENTSRMQINQIKVQNLLDRANDRNATLQEIAQVRADAQVAAAQLRVDAANQRALSGRIDTATGRMLITSEDANIKASTNQMQMLSRELENEPQMVAGKPNPRLADIRAQVQGLRDDIKQSQANKQSYLRSMNIQGTGGAAATPPGGNNGAPYPEGTKLTGPGGAPYIVQGGVPVPVTQ